MCGGVAIFDFDNDGRPDIFFTNGAHFPEMQKTDPSFYNCLLHQKSDGTFEDVTARAGLSGAGLGYNFGVAVGDYTAAAAHAAWKKIVACLERDGSRPVVDRVFDFEDVKLAFARLAEGPMGKVLVRVA